MARHGKWFHLARYHDMDHSQNGPDSLAAFPGLEVDEVFPIAYDITAFCIGHPAALKGLIARTGCSLFEA